MQSFRDLQELDASCLQIRGSDILDLDLRGHANGPCILRLAAICLRTGELVRELFLLDSKPYHGRINTGFLCELVDRRLEMGLFLPGSVRVSGR